MTTSTSLPSTDRPEPEVSSATAPSPHTLTGADLLCEALQLEGATLIYGYPGGAILPTYDALTRYPGIHHVLTRHEQGACHMADGFARATGQVGVVMATSGPGATNLVTGLANAMMDSVPLVAITGQVPRPFIGTDAFQETDVTGITLPITKHNYLVTSVSELADVLCEAFHIARTGRPGPVLVDIPKDVQNEEVEFDAGAYLRMRESLTLPGYRPVPRASPEQLEGGLRLLEASRRPVILAGHGVTMAGAERELLELAERAQIPVALTLLGKGAMSEDHPLCLGMMGMHGAAEVNQAIQEADLLIALGMRFDDRVTGDLANYAVSSRKIHVDVDPAEIGKNVAVDVGIVGDLKQVLSELLQRAERCASPEWLDRITDWRDDSRRRDIVVSEPATRTDDGPLWAAHVIHDLYRLTDGEAVVVTDVGQHQMWEAQYYRHHRPRTLITSGGLGTMGFGLPAAIGARMGLDEHPTDRPEEVWAIVGDGGFQMTLMELATAVQERVRVNIAIVNNGYLGMVRQWQEFFYDSRYSQTPMFNPDFCALAAAYGIPAWKVERRSEVAETVASARAIESGPALIEFVVEKEDIVYPMVPTGARLDEMIRRPLKEESEGAS